VNDLLRILRCSPVRIPPVLLTYLHPLVLSYQKKKRTKPGILLKIKVLSEIGEDSIEENPPPVPWPLYNTLGRTDCCGPQGTNCEVRGLVHVYTYSCITSCLFNRTVFNTHVYLLLKPLLCDWLSRRPCGWQTCVCSCSSKLLAAAQ
jgi:hypothetical protein